MSVIRHANFGLRGFSPRQVSSVPVEIDREHPLAKGLVAYWVLAGPSGLNDLCGNVPRLTPSPAARMGLGPQGPAWLSNADDMGLSVPAPAILQRTDSASIWWLGYDYADATSYGAPLVGVLSDTTSYFNAYGLYARGPLNGASPTNGDGHAMQTTDANTTEYIALATYTPNHTSMTGTASWPAGGSLLYRDGVSVASVATTGTPTYPAPVLSINGYSVAVSRTLNKTCTAAAIWGGRVLTASEIAWLHAEPFAMLRPIQRRRFYLPNTAVAAPTAVRPRITMIA